jgi:hypothetical protein
MGVGYSVIPFGTLSKKDLADMRRYLAENGLEFPPGADQSRFPTQNEMEAVLKSFKSHEVEFWPKSVVGTDQPWTQAALFKRAQAISDVTFEEYVSLIALPVPPNKNSPCGFYLSKGDEHLNYAVLERLAYQCGPLFCITEGECDAVIFHRKLSRSNPSPSFATNHHLHREGA